MSSSKEIAEYILKDGIITTNAEDVYSLARAYLELEKEITKLKKSREGLRKALEHTWPGCTYAIDVNAFNRNALKADDEIMGDEK